MKASTLITAVFVGATILVLPSFLYLNSNFIGWTVRKQFSGEPIFFLVVFVLFMVASVVIKRKIESVVKFRVAIILLGSITVLGSLLPWLANPPHWAPNASLQSLYSLESAEAVETRLTLVGRVGHGGGAYFGEMTNSLEALAENQEKYTYFEIDLSETSDGFLVCVHDWESFWKDSTGVKQFHSPSLTEFVVLRDELPYTPCTLTELRDWVAMTNVKIVLDVKASDEVGAYLSISDQFGSLSQFLIPQVYKMSQVAQVSNGAWAGIVLTLYRHPLPNPENLQTFFETQSVSALTVPSHKVTPEICGIATEFGVPVYAHTVNDLQEFLKLREIGVSDIYTDSLTEFR